MPAPTLSRLGRKQSKRKRETGGRSGPPATRAGQPQKPSSSFPGSKRWLWRLSVLILVPLALVGTLELGLRLGGYGYPTGYFKKTTIGGEEFLVDNDQFGLRFFPPALARIPPPVVMRAKKPAGTFRIFIFGESAAEGDPRPQYGAARCLEVLLRERFPETHFEVVNTAVTAINSHVIRAIAQDCSTREGDLWILYIGNNEMIGPFGAATAFGQRAPPLGFVRLSLALQKTRMGQLLMSMARKLTPVSHGPASWAGMEMFLENKLPPGDARKDVVYRNFRKNLEDILNTGSRSGAKMLLSTVAVNLRDCPPFASIDETNLEPAPREACAKISALGLAAATKGDWTVAEQSYRQAVQLNPASADWQFRLGESLLGVTNAAEARMHFQTAVDDDCLIFRADSKINGVIRAAASQFAVRGVALCDAEKELAKANPENIPGRDLFYEHVHFNFDGNYQLARAWAENVRAMLPPTAAKGAHDEWASQKDCERSLGLTDWNRVSIIEEMIRRLQLAPFNQQSANAQRLTALRREAEGVRKRMTTTPVADAKGVYLEALKRSPRDYQLHENFADFLEMTHDLNQAVEERKQVCALIPYYYFPYYSLGRALKENGQLAEAQASLLRAVELNPRQGKVHLELGVVLARRNQWKEAGNELEIARQLSPADPQILLFGAEVVWKLDRPAQAIECLRQAVQLDPDYWEAHYRLGEYVAMQNRIPEAVTEFKKVLRLNPNYTRAHMNLAVALLKMGLTDEAAQEFEETLRLDPSNPQAQDFMARYSKTRKRQ